MEQELGRAETRSAQRWAETSWAPHPILAERCCLADFRGSLTLVYRCLSACSGAHRPPELSKNMPYEINISEYVLPECVLLGAARRRRKAPDQPTATVRLRIDHQERRKRGSPGTARRLTKHARGALRPPSNPPGFPSGPSALCGRNSVFPFT